MQPKKAVQSKMRAKEYMYKITIIAYRSMPYAHEINQNGGKNLFYSLCIKKKSKIVNSPEPINCSMMRLMLL